MTKLIIQIPCLNEAATLPATLRDLPNVTDRGPFEEPPGSANSDHVDVRVPDGLRTVRPDVNSIRFAGLDPGGHDVHIVSPHRKGAAQLQCMNTPAMSSRYRCIDGGVKNSQAAVALEVPWSAGFANRIVQRDKISEP